MELTPSKIHEEYLKNNLDKHSAAKLLISLIDNSESDKLRVESIQGLEKIKIDDNKSFRFLENLLISDSSEKVRNSAALILKNLYIDRALEPMKWTLVHEESPSCLNIIHTTLIKIIEKLVEGNQQILLSEVKKIREREFRISLEQLCEVNSIENFTSKELAEILINYFTLSLLKKTYWRLKFKIENCKFIELDFIFKGLTKIPEPIKYLSSLKTLIFRYNQLTALPEWIGNLTSLESLNLNVNNIKMLPETIGSLVSLKELFLWKNELRTLPKSIGSLSRLERINLRLNQIESLPDTIGNLSSLREFNLHDNKLPYLPETLGCLKSLEDLNLSWNEIRDLPSSIGKLTALKVLDLERNELTAIPEEITSLKSLKVLNLSDNKLNSIPDKIGNLTSLQYLYLSRNRLNNLPESLKYLTKLKELYLSENNLTKSLILLNKLEEKGAKIYF